MLRARNAWQAHRKVGGVLVRIQPAKAQAFVERARALVRRIHLKVHAYGSPSGELVEQGLDAVKEYDHGSF